MVVKLAGGGGDLLVDDGVAGDSCLGSVDAGIVAGREPPDYGWGGGLGGRNDDFGDGLVLLFGDEN